MVDIKTDGKDAFTIELKSGDAGFPYIISDYHIAIMPANGDKPDWQSGIGAGAFKLDSGRKGSAWSPELGKSSSFSCSYSYSNIGGQTTTLCHSVWTNTSTRITCILRRQHGKGPSAPLDY